MQLVLENVTVTMTSIHNDINKIRFFFLIIICLSTSFNFSRFCKYVLQLCTSFLIKSYLFTSAFNMSDSETNLLKFELGISNDLASILYLPIVSGDNNFICRSSARQMP
jgi:hypothetical protein